MPMPTPEHANEKRIVGSIQVFPEGQRTIKWFQDVIGSDAPLASEPFSPDSI
jgi:hypothetical protein